MPFSGALSAGNYTSLRADYAYSSQHLAYVPQTTVFRCKSTQTLSGVFAEFTYGSVDVGAYTDAKIGMVVYITDTTSLRNPLYIGRVRKAPTASTFYISESAFNLSTSYYINVINDYDLVEKLGRVGTDGTIYVDYDLTYQKQSILFGGLQSSYVSHASTTTSFSFAPTATALEPSATISTWLWDVSDGTITVGSTSTQNITASFPAGFRWVRLTVTDSNGVSNYFVFTVHVGTTYTIQNIDSVSITGDIESGFNADLTTWYSSGITDALRSIPDRTRVTLYSLDNFDGTTTPILTNVDMVGRFRQETSTTTGDDQYSVLQSASFSIEGFGTQLARLSSPQLSVTKATTPTLWTEMKNPTPVRLIGLLATRYSTLSNLCCMTFDSAYQNYVSKSFTVTDTSSGTAMAGIAWWFNAQLAHATSGEILISRNAFYLSTAEKTALTTVATLQTQDILDFNIERDYVQSVGQVFTGAERYTSSTDIVQYITGKAPSTSRGNGEQIAQYDGQILLSDQTDANSLAEMNSRTAAFYATSQPLDTVRVTLRDTWRNVLIPTVNQWYVLEIASTDNERGITYSTGQRWLLKSISSNPDITSGMRDCTAIFVKEPNTASAQVWVGIAPEITDFVNPVLPTLPPYSAFPPDPTVNYLDTDVPDEDLQLDGYSSSVGYGTQSPDQNAQTGQYTSNPNCVVFSINMRNPSYTDLIDLGSGSYTITASGDGVISTSTGWRHTFDFTVSQQGFTFNTSSARATYVGGSGWARGSSTQYWSIQTTASGYTFSWDSVTVEYSASWTVPTSNIVQTSYAGNFGAGHVFPASTTYGGGTISASSIFHFGSATNPFPSGVYLQKIIFEGSGGTDPLATLGLSGTSEIIGSGTARGDSFYRGYDSGSPTVYPSGEGLLLKNFSEGSPTAIATPLFNSNHEYTFAYTGNGILQAKFGSSDYSQVSNNVIVLRICSA